MIARTNFTTPAVPGKRLAVAQVWWYIGYGNDSTKSTNTLTEGTMRACVQRVSRAKVTLPDTGEVTGEIGHGILVLLGVREGDGERDATFLASKVAQLRIFEDNAGKMNLGLLDVDGEALVVSQFTLYSDCRKGRRPGFTEAARPDIAQRLYEQFVAALRELGVRVATGTFQREMAVELVNSGPVTLLVDTDHLS